MSPDEKRYWFVDIGHGWFVVQGRTKRAVKSWVVQNEGRGVTKEIRLATDSEVEGYRAQKKEIEVIDNES